MGRTTNPLIDAIAGARWVPRLRRDTVIASSCIPVPKPVVHRSRGTRRRDSTASGDPTVRIPMSWPCVDPSPIWKRSQVACLHGPRVWTIPQRAKEKARILAWWLSSTSSFRRSSLPRWNFYAFGERGELRGPHLALSSPTLEPRSLRVLNQAFINPHILVRQDQSPLLKEVSGFASPCSSLSRNLSIHGSAPTPQRIHQC